MKLLIILTVTCLATLSHAAEKTTDKEKKNDAVKAKDLVPEEATGRSSYAPRPPLRNRPSPGNEHGLVDEYPPYGYGKVPSSNGHDRPSYGAGGGDGSGYAGGGYSSGGAYGDSSYIAPPASSGYGSSSHSPSGPAPSGYGNPPYSPPASGGYGSSPYSPPAPSGYASSPYSPPASNGYGSSSYPAAPPSSSSVGYAGSQYSQPAPEGYGSAPYSPPASTGYGSSPYSPPSSSGYGAPAPYSPPASSGYGGSPYSPPAPSEYGSSPYSPPSSSSGYGSAGYAPAPPPSGYSGSHSPPASGGSYTSGQRIASSVGYSAPYPPSSANAPAPPASPVSSGYGSSYPGSSSHPGYRSPVRGSSAPHGGSYGVSYPAGSSGYSKPRNTYGSPNTYHAPAVDYNREQKKENAYSRPYRSNKKVSYESPSTAGQSYRSSRPSRPHSSGGSAYNKPRSSYRSLSKPVSTGYSSLTGSSRPSGYGGYADPSTYGDYSKPARSHGARSTYKKKEKPADSRGYLGHTQAPTGYGDYSKPPPSGYGASAGTGYAAPVSHGQPQVDAYGRSYGTVTKTEYTKTFESSKDTNSPSYGGYAGDAYGLRAKARSGHGLFGSARYDAPYSLDPYGGGESRQYSADQSIYGGYGHLY